MWKNKENKKEVTETYFLVKLLSALSGLGVFCRDTIYTLIDSISDTYKIYCNESVDDLVELTILKFTVSEEVN